MYMPNASCQNSSPKPYRPLKDDPKFDQVRKLISNFPREKLVSLKKYIKDLEKS